MTTPAPAVHPTTERLYRDLGEGATRGDADGGYLLLRLLEGWGALLGDVDDRVRATADGDGWEQELDVDVTRSPAWLGQFVGVTIPDGTPDARARELVRERRSFRRGSPAQLIEVARAHLTGSARVDLRERDGSAYRVTVTTYATETPDPAAVLEALMEAKPAGLLLTHEVLQGVPYDERDAAHLTYDALDASAATYDQLDRNVTGGA